MRYSAAELNAISRAVGRERDRRRYRRLHDFFVGMWPVVEGGNLFQDNWHIELICEHLEGVVHGTVKNLLCNIPPGCSKSLVCSVAFPVWAWAVNPELRFLTASYGSELSTRDAVKSRVVIDSEWFQELWGDRVKLDRNQNQKTKYQNTRGGWRLSTSVGGRATGEHPDVVIVDDPHTAAEAASDAERQCGIDWFDFTLSTRGASRGVHKIVIMQRLHDKDLSGHIMASQEYEEDWCHVCLPMRGEEFRYKSTIGKDPRKEGELLWPGLFPEHTVRKLELTLGEYGAAGQLQQRPSPPGGGILRTKHFQLWSASEPLPRYTFVLQSYDTAFKEAHQPSKTKKRAPDYSACSVYGLFTHPKDGRPAVMVLDAWEERLPYPKLRERAIRDWDATYGEPDAKPKASEPRRLSEVAPYEGRKADAVVVEDKASGQSLIQDLRMANVPVTAYDPKQADKVQKAHLAAPVLELDRFFVLESKHRRGKPVSWVVFMLERLEKFPNDEYDDIVDTFTQACIFMKNNRVLDLAFVPPEEEEDRDYSKRKVNPYAS